MALTNSNTHKFQSGELVTADKLNNTQIIQSGNTSANDAFTGTAGQITYDNQTKKLRVHDGTTAGGFVIQRATDAQSISTGDIGSNELANDAVTSIKIADNAVTTNKILDSAVTLAKIESIATSKVIGRTTAGSGAPELVPILDEDNMGSNSNISLATQQSIKAYIDTAISGVTGSGSIYAFSSPSITTEGLYTVNYPSGWTGGTPTKVFVSTRYPTGNGSSQQWFQVVSFNATSVTIFAQSQAVTTFGAVIADLLIVKN